LVAHESIGEKPWRSDGIKNTTGYFLFFDRPHDIGPKAFQQMKSARPIVHQ